MRVSLRIDSWRQAYKSLAFEGPRKRRKFLGVWCNAPQIIGTTGLGCWCRTLEVRMIGAPPQSVKVLKLAACVAAWDIP